MTLRRLKLTSDFAGAATVDTQFTVRPGIVIKHVNGGFLVTPGAGKIVRFYVMENDYAAYPSTAAQADDCLFMWTMFEASAAGEWHNSFAQNVEIPVRASTLTLLIQTDAAIDACVLNVYYEDGEFAPVGAKDRMKL